MLGLGSGLITEGGVLESWTPLNLGSTLDLWLQYNTGITSDGGTPDLVSEWQDQSGNSRHAQQAADGNKPSTTSGYVQFDDASNADHLTLATGDGAISYGNGDPFTAIVAINRDTNTETDRFVGGDSSEFLGLGGEGTALSPDRVQVRGSGTLCVPIFDDIDILTTGTDYVITITRDASMFVRVYKNNDILLLNSSTSGYDAGNPYKLAMNTNNTDMSLKRVGAGQSTSSTNAYDGKIYELLVCDTLLSDDDRNLAINYIKSKLGI